MATGLALIEQRRCTHSNGFHDAETGAQLAKTNIRARTVTVTIIDILMEIGMETCFRRSRRMQVKPMPHLTTVDEMK